MKILNLISLFILAIVMTSPKVMADCDSHHKQEKEECHKCHDDHHDEEEQHSDSKNHCHENGCAMTCCHMSLIPASSPIELVVSDQILFLEHLQFSFGNTNNVTWEPFRPPIRSII
jgi:hypothetical protein